LPEDAPGWNDEQVTAGQPILHLPAFPLARGLVVAAYAALLALGCKGSVEADAKASSSGEADVDFDSDKKRDEAWESEAFASGNSKAPTASGTEAAANPAAPATLLGARHDLTLTGSRTPACQCIAVIAGEPSRSGLAWSGPTPQIDPKTQLVVALGSDQISCPVQVPPASYMGYEVREANVVVQLEAAVAGRPLTQGAIVPRPMTGGKLLIEAPADLPYGKAITGKGPCTVPY
jgi:hypothetical protein